MQMERKMKEEGKCDATVMILYRKAIIRQSPSKYNVYLEKKGETGQQPDRIVQCYK